ncbi:MAG TPA: hypothetical protein VK202_06615 [Bacteroidia bacterium]|nr:hypothetical protein [Bacteroidia bacterium]
MKKYEKEYIVEKMQEILHAESKRLSKKGIAQLAALTEKVKQTNTSEGLIKTLLDLFLNNLKQ